MRVTDLYDLPDDPPRPPPDDLREPWRPTPWRWLPVLLAVLGLVGWTLRWHLTINRTTVVQAPVNYNRRAMTAWECSQVRDGEPEHVVRATFGQGPGADYHDGDRDSVGVVWPGDADLYDVGSPQAKSSCFVFYDQRHRVKFVFEELLP